MLDLSKVRTFTRSAPQLKSICAYSLIIFCAAACSPPSDSGAPESTAQAKAPQVQNMGPQITLPQGADDYQKHCDLSYANTTSLFREIEKGSHNTNSISFLTAINNLHIALDRALGTTSLFSNVHPDESIRTIAEKCQQQFVSLISEINLSRALFKQFSNVDISNFSEVDQRFVKNQIRDFKRSGVNLSEEKRSDVKSLNDEILLLGQQFSKNIRDDVRSVTLDSADKLAGMPDDFIAKHPANEDGKIIVTTNYPDYYPIQQYAHNDQLRFDLYKLFKQRGNPTNTQVLKDLLTKRNQLAQLLGYSNYAEYITETVMIKSPKNAEDFINKINDIAQNKAQEEYDQLLEVLKTTSPDATKVGDWQKMYLSDRIKKDTFQVDSQEVRQYFQYQNVTQGVFDLVETIFQVKIRPWETEVWHPRVTAHELVENGKVIGRFYLDMHPREGKYKHAAAFSLQEGIQDVQLPIHTLVCNFPGEKSGEELMEHGEVETFLHEFGHLLHGQFGGHGKWLVDAGTNTERDFVEAPSQMLEEWVWDAETLKTFAKNANGETIPDELIVKMKASRDYGKGIFTKHQMYYAGISLNFYNQDPQQLNMVDTVRTLKHKYSNFGYVENTYFHESFGHLYGYSAVYYTYMWSLVIASDMFSEFKKHGLRNAEIANKYRQTILAAGGSKDAEELIRDFLGRDYNFDAFAKDLEVTPKP